MRDFIIDVGKSLFYLGFAKTTSGAEPNDFQCFGLGCYILGFGALMITILIIIGILWSIKHLQNKGRN